MPFYNVNSATMERVVLFLREFNPFVAPVLPVTAKNCTLQSVFAEDEFRSKFFEQLEPEQLRELAEAANFMCIEVLMDSCSAAIALLLKQAQMAYAKDLLGDEAAKNSLSEIGYLQKPLSGDE